MTRLARFARVLLAITLGLAVPSCFANAVLEWNAIMMAAIRLDNTGPTLSTRNLAILHLAIYDSVNSVLRSHQPYLFLNSVPPGASAEAAVHAAGHEIILALYPSLRARADETFQTWLASTLQTESVQQGLVLGKQIAHLTLAARSDDGASTEVPYIPNDAPGAWRRTPPFFRPPLTPQWRYVRLFALPLLELYVPAPPPSLDSAEYAASLNEVKLLGEKTSSVRTAEQTQIAVFWSDFSYTAMPPGHWHEITASIARSQGTDLASTARLMALLSLAQADSAIVCWEAKYRYNLWRPITAIQRADEDQNPLTDAAKPWDHLLASPPFPAYTSGHSTFSKASAEVLTGFYGTDSLSFTAASDSLPGVFRHFTSLSACADEVGMSRIYGGIHFPFDNVAGKRTGASIAAVVLSNYLLPNDRLPQVRLEQITNDTVELRVHGHFGKPIDVESSTDLEHWESAGKAEGVRGGMVLELRKPPGGQRFYRAREF